MGEKKYNLAIVGATGLVGVELLTALSERRFPVADLKLYASFNSAGEKLDFMDEEIRVEPLSAEFYQGRDLIFFAAHQMVSRDLAEKAAESGAMVIDSSRAFRLDPDVPLVVPEVNPDSLDRLREGRAIVASPSGQAVAMALVAAPIRVRFGLQRIIATLAHGSTFGGRPGFEEHQAQTIDIFSQEDPRVERFARQTAFNVFPRVGEFEGVDTAAERELIEELPRILGTPLPVATTSMQVPIFCGLSISACLELTKTATAAEIREALVGAAGVKVMDDPDQEVYPDTLEAMASDEVLVGRVRQDQSRPQAVHLWISSDNLRKGSARNMVQIAEMIVAMKEDKPATRKG